MDEKSDWTLPKNHGEMGLDWFIYTLYLNGVNPNIRVKTWKYWKCHGKLEFKTCCFNWLHNVSPMILANMFLLPILTCSNKPRSQACWRHGWVSFSITLWPYDTLRMDSCHPNECETDHIRRARPPVLTTLCESGFIGAAVWRRSWRPKLLVGFGGSSPIVISILMTPSFTTYILLDQFGLFGITVG